MERLAMTARFLAVAVLSLIVLEGRAQASVQLGYDWCPFANYLGCYEDECAECESSPEGCEADEGSCEEDIYEYCQEEGNVFQECNYSCIESSPTNGDCCLDGVNSITGYCCDGDPHAEGCDPF